MALLSFKLTAILHCYFTHITDILTLMLQSTFATECPKWLHKIIFDYIGLDWIYLLVLGIIMALLSFLIDYCITQIQRGKWIYN